MMQLLERDKGQRQQIRVNLSQRGKSRSPVDELIMLSRMDYNLLSRRIDESTFRQLLTVFNSVPIVVFTPLYFRGTLTLQSKM